MISIEPDLEAILLGAARRVPDGDRDRFFADVADLLRPRVHIGIEPRDVHAATGEATRRLGLAATEPRGGGAR